MTKQSLLSIPEVLIAAMADLKEIKNGCITDIDRLVKETLTYVEKLQVNVNYDLVLYNNFIETFKDYAKRVQKERLGLTMDLDTNNIKEIVDNISQLKATLVTISDGFTYKRTGFEVETDEEYGVTYYTDKVITLETFLNAETMVEDINNVGYYANTDEGIRYITNNPDFIDKESVIYDANLE